MEKYVILRNDRRRIGIWPLKRRPDGVIWPPRASQSLHAWLKSLGATPALRLDLVEAPPAGVLLARVVESGVVFAPGHANPDGTEYDCFWILRSDAPGVKLALQLAGRWSEEGVQVVWQNDFPESKKGAWNDECRLEQNADRAAKIAKTRGARDIQRRYRKRVAKADQRLRESHDPSDPRN